MDELRVVARYVVVVRCVVECAEEVLPVFEVAHRPKASTGLGEIIVSSTNPYLVFNGNARHAMEFYASVFGGNLAFNTLGGFGAPDSPDADKILHSS